MGKDHVEFRDVTFHNNIYFYVHVNICTRRLLSTSPDARLRRAVRHGTARP